MGVMRLKAIERTDQDGARLASALKIYRETILPEAQNPENQILYWIEHGREGFADQFRCFSIEGEQGVIGYLQYSYFSEENMLYVEYLCITAGTTGLGHSAAIEAIQKHFFQKYPHDAIISFEVAKIHGENGVWESDTPLVNYFQWLGFRTVTFDYQYPVLQSYDNATSYPADLMVRLPARKIDLTATELRTMLRCIYFKHYLRWDRPFLDDANFARREKLINELYSKQIGRIGGSGTFKTDGRIRRSPIDLAKFLKPRLKPLIDKVFGPKLPRLIGAAAVVFVFQRIIGNSWAMIPFTLVVLIVYCLAEDTKASQKLLLVLAARLNISPPPSQ